MPRDATDFDSINWSCKFIKSDFAWATLTIAGFMTENNGYFTFTDAADPNCNPLIGIRTSHYLWAFDQTISKYVLLQQNDSTGDTYVATPVKITCPILTFTTADQCNIKQALQDWVFGHKS